MKEQLLEKIRELYFFYNEYQELFAAKQKELQKMKEELASKEDVPSPDEVEKVFVSEYVDIAIYGHDLQLIASRLAYYMDVYVEIVQEELPQHMQSLYNQYKASYPTMSFMVKEGKLIEAEEGLLEENRKKFLESDYYKQLRKVLNV